MPHKGAIACSKWLVMKPYDIKIAMLRLNTKNSQIIKQYYIKMEELIRLYAHTQRYLLKKKRTNV